MLRSLLCCHTSRRDSHMSLKSLIQRFPRKCTIIGGTDTKWRRLRKSQPFCLWYKQLFVWSAKLLANAVFLARQKHSSRGIVKAILFFFSFFFLPRLCVGNPNYFLEKIMASCSPRLYHRKSQNDVTKTFKPQTSLFSQWGGQKWSNLCCSDEAHFL